MKKYISMELIIILALIFIENTHIKAAEVPTTEEITTEYDSICDYTSKYYDEFYREDETLLCEEIAETIKYYTVEFIDKVNNTKKVIEVAEGNVIEPLKLEKSSFRLKNNRNKFFTGWIDENGNEYNFAQKVTGDLTLYANFYTEKINERNVDERIVTFDSQGGTQIKSPKTGINYSGIVGIMILSSVISIYSLLKIQNKERY